MSHLLPFKKQQRREYFRKFSLFLSEFPPFFFIIIPKFFLLRWVKTLEEQAQSGCQDDFFPKVKGADRQKNYVMKNL